MATSENEKKGILGFLTGALGTIGVEEAVKAVREHINTAATEKAHELFEDSGHRAETMVAVAKLTTAGMSDDQKAEAGKQARAWIVKAWKKNHEEGELTSLLKKIPDEDKPAVLVMLGKSADYDEFVDTIRAFLIHDNVGQVLLKFADRVESTGGRIASDDVHKVVNAAAYGLNNAAQVALPYLRELEARLNKRKENDHGGLF